MGRGRHAGYEDQQLKDELYLRIMRVFLHRIERKRIQEL